MSDVILTGVPRSGTTLTCHLLNQLPNTLALHEPINTWVRGADHAAACDTIERFFGATRASALGHGMVATKHIGGRLPVNPISERYGESGLRPALAQHGEVKVDKPLGEGFLLVIKHPAAFTALLASLVGRFPCYAVIRNPLSVLCSWNSIDVPVFHGHAPAAESRDARLAEALGRIDDRVARQLHLLSWFFDAYRRVLPAHAILRYEDTVASRGRSLRAITPLAERLDEPLESKNASELYDKALMRSLGERLLAADGAFWDFYSRESVRALL